MLDIEVYKKRVHIRFPLTLEEEGKVRDELVGWAIVALVITGNSLILDLVPGSND